VGVEHEHGALLEATVERTIRQCLSAHLERLGDLAFRAALDSDETRRLVVALLFDALGSEPAKTLRREAHSAAWQRLKEPAPTPPEADGVCAVQWVLVRDMMAPGGYWLAGVDRQKLAQVQAKGKGARGLAGCLSFLEQQIVRSVDRPPSRSARRRLEREQPMGTPASAVKVIELRRRDYTSSERADDASHASAWQWQWVVSGHWRQQHYPKSNVHKPRYIAPYVKGPSDKPLKAPAGSVFAVTR
jgi:hypothetical protein